MHISADHESSELFYVLIDSKKTNKKVAMVH